MQGYPGRLLAETATLTLAFSGLFACAGPSDSPGRQDPLESFRGAATGETGSDFVTSTLIDASPAALVDGTIVDWGEMRPLLNEAAGLRGTSFPEQAQEQHCHPAATADLTPMPQPSSPQNPPQFARN